MRKYYPKYLSKEAYMRVLSVAKEYYEMVKTRKIIEYDKIYSTPNHEIGGHSNTISNPVQSIVEQIDKHSRLLDERIRAVEFALSMFDADEQYVILQNIMQGIPIRHCNALKAVSTIKSTRHDFLIYLAFELGEITK